MSHRKRLVFLTVFTYFTIVLIAVLFFLYIFPNREAIQNWMNAQGVWGPLLFLGLAALSVIIAPMNFSMVGLAGGFLYGTPLAFFLLWTGRSAGHLINFWLARRFGRKVLLFFIKEESTQHYDALLKSEKAVQLYFMLCFLPFMPGEYLAYLLGASDLKKSVFLAVTLLGTTGSAFSVAYLGSGQAFTNPFFLILFFIFFFAGLTWIHQEKKKLQLQ